MYVRENFSIYQLQFPQKDRLFLFLLLSSKKKINKKDVHPPSSSNPLPSSLLLCTCVFEKSRETPCTSAFQAISGWGWGDYICKFLYNKKVAIFFRLYHFYVYIPPSPPNIGANQFNINKLSNIFRII